MEAKRKFYRDVDRRSRKDMVDFLENHFRYDTMNSWNRSTSYANNVKIYGVIPDTLQDKVYELQQVDGFYDDINDILSVWACENDFTYQAGFNGRSSGYIVMYEGYVEAKTIFEFNDKTMNSYGRRDYADGYGWLSIEEAKRMGLYKKQIKKIHSYPGRSIDMGADFSEWDIGSLKNRVSLVQSFDKMCDDVVQCVIDMAETRNVVEETIMVPKTVKHIE